MSKMPLATLEKVAQSELQTKGRTLKRIKHWQRQLWKAAL